MYISGVKIENFRGIGKETIFKFNPGITVLVGENDSGKSTVIDAIRYVLGTTDQNWYKVEFSDYHNENTEDEIRISICFSDLSLKEKAAFMECLTYTKTGEKLYLNWTAKYMKNVKPNRTLVNLTCGKNGDVSAPSPEARELLRVTYLRPLRDAYAQMRAGRNSRLAQIMSSISGLNSGIDKYESGVDVNELSLSGIFDLSNYLLANHEQIKQVNENINKILKQKIMLNGDTLDTEIVVSGLGNTEERKVYSLLEKLDLQVHNANSNNYGNVGLGTSNLLSMACEMLLNSDSENSSFMLIEEPEAHIHAQRQLKMMQSLQGGKKNQQIIMTTHSLMLTSVVELKNLVLLQEHKAYPMGKEYTLLDDNDYKYLERYLDATKANLFFAKGVLIVEGPGEELLLPSIAKLIGRNLTDYGISIVDVKSTGLMRYAKIFQRKNDDWLKLPVACITDRDILPDCAPAICIKSDYSDKAKWPKSRKWKVESEITDKKAYLDEIKNKSEGQHVKVYIPKQWTLEYELALSGLAVDMLNVIAEMRATELKESDKEELIEEYTGKYATYNTDEEKASYVYSFFRKKYISKAEFAQYFFVYIEEKYAGKAVNEMEKIFPSYLVEAIKYVTSTLTV